MIRIVIIAILLGVALAMDAFAISIVDGLEEPNMKKKKALFISANFGLFQGLMPFCGYLLGFVLLSKIEWLIPYVALILLTFLGVRMLIDGFTHNEEEKIHHLGIKVILLQAVATSIDALSVGFTISNYTFIEALITCLIVTFMTFIICLFGVIMGEKFGKKLGNKAILLGGIILIAIGLEIFITSFI